MHYNTGARRGAGRGRPRPCRPGPVEGQRAHVAAAPEVPRPTSHEEVPYGRFAETAPETSRRKFLRGAAVAAATGAALAAPSVVKAQGPITMRWQSTWPAKDIFQEYALDFAKKVNDTTGGDLKIDVLPAGAVVPAFGLLDAVSKGTLDGGHGVLVYHYGKQTALALWGSGPAFGMDANMLLSWHKYGGGKQLLDKLYKSINANVVSFPYGPMPTQPLGWFKKPITKADDLKGLKFRTVGISIDVFTGLGAAVNALPGGEIVPAMDRGLLDAAEFNNATSDRILGFADVSKVCMLQSYHQNAEQFEILFNKTKFDALPGQDEGPHRDRRGDGLGRHVLEEPIKSLFEGLHRAADQGRGKDLHDAGRPPEATTRGCPTRPPIRRRATIAAVQGSSASPGDSYAGRAPWHGTSTPTSAAAGLRPLLRRAGPPGGLTHRDASQTSQPLATRRNRGPGILVPLSAKRLLHAINQVSTPGRAKRSPGSSWP